MADPDLGEDTRLAAAWICFEDEAGQTLRPPRARTWGPRGHTPVVAVSGKGSGRVSIAGLVAYQPGQRAHRAGRPLQPRPGTPLPTAGHLAWHDREVFKVAKNEARTPPNGDSPSRASGRSSA